MIADQLRREIEATGPMLLSRFMGLAVAHYYAGQDPLGRRGDFITAPEISQMFGEVIGLWAAVVWQMMGSPDDLILAELGPGRGTLMADLLRAAATVPDFAKAVRVHLVETSPSMRQRQQQALSETKATWHDRVDQLPQGPAIIIANEFFDALPIDQFVRRADGWHQRMVDLGDEFRMVDGPLAEGGNFPPADVGEIFEVNQAARDVAAQLGQRFAHAPGAALLIDYGHARQATGDTLQAVGKHQAVPPLSAPGQVDLTSHVDFAALADAARPANVTPVATQGAFLRRLGIELRAAKLAAARPDQATDIHAACQRLINTGGMGTLFKVLALSSARLTDLPGFAQ
jgi:SAM-dependent MidA family methyltransferase